MTAALAVLRPALMLAKQGDDADVALAFVFLAVVIVVSLIAAAIRGPANYDLLVSKTGLPYCPRCNRQVSYRRDCCRACGYTFKTYGYDQEPQEAMYARGRQLEADEQEAIRERERARARARACERAERAARAEQKRQAREAYYRESGVEPGPMAWYRVLPDWQQAIVLGLAFAAPAVVLLALLMR